MASEEISSPGWDAITEECLRVYPGQNNPIHYGTLISWDLGGDDPLEGISVYDGGSYYHFVSYGLSELYEKTSFNKEVSGYGMEFTFKLKKDNYDSVEAEMKCLCGILQAIARFTFKDGERFNENEYIYTGQREGIDVKGKSNITGFITILDTSLNTIDTPNGRVKFIELIGVTHEELTAIRRSDISIKELYEKLGTDITSYNRESLL